MTETNNSGDKSLGGAAGKATLHLKRPVEQGTVRQSFSHGRSKVVVVEKKRSAHRPGEAAPVAAAPTPAPAVAAKPNVAPAPAPRGPTVGAPRPSAPPPKTGVILRTLSDEQREARARALAEANAREQEDRQRQEAEAAARREREEREKAEREAAEARKREEEARRSQEASFKRQSEEEARRRLAGGEPAATPTVTLPRKVAAPTPPPAPAAAGAPAAAATPTPAAPPRAADGDAAKRTPRKIIAPVAPPKVMIPAPRPTKGAEQRNRGRLTVASATAEPDEERTRSVAAFRRRTQRLKGYGQHESREKISREIVLPETITIQELANRMSERAVDVIKFLMRQGRMVTLTDTLDADTAELVAEDLGHTVRRVAESDVEDGLFQIAGDSGDSAPRPPIVTIMGHVDHGKTSLLDAIRHANVVSGEAGGITQHIGAYQVVAPGGEKITFIDTPGHAAFTAMRARGAKVTDIVVLVVAADDGVMPQTIEAIRHAKAARAPIIVAINKIDKPEANPQRVMQELLQHDVQVEAFGGETLAVEVSAKQHTNLDKLLEAIALQAELLDLAADPDRNPEGTVIEARLDRGRGPVATVLVQRGTLKIGQIVVAGSQWGRVRALLNDHGDNVVEALPSTPVEVLGFDGAPEAGDRVASVENEARAREIAEYRERQKREKLAARGSSVARTSLHDMMTNLKSTSGLKELPIVIKGDVQGSVEAITAALEKLGTEEVAARVIHGGVGGVTESDVTLATASKAVIIGFNVRAHKEARDQAERDGVEIRYYNIIYNLVDDVKAAMSGMLAPTMRETMLGNAQILEVFNISKVGNVAGCRVTDGVVQRGSHVRLIRDNVVIHEGKLATLKRFKDEVAVVQAGQDCGMAFENYADMRKGDVIECYSVEEIRRTL